MLAALSTWFTGATAVTGSVFSDDTETLDAAGIPRAGAANVQVAKAITRAMIKSMFFIWLFTSITLMLFASRVLNVAGLPAAGVYELPTDREA